MVNINTKRENKRAKKEKKDYNAEKSEYKWVTQQAEMNNRDGRVAGV